MPCCVCDLRGMANWIICLSSVCLVTGFAVMVLEFLVDEDGNNPSVIRIARLLRLIRLIPFALFVMLLVLLYKFRVPTRPYRRVILPLTAFKLLLDFADMIFVELDLTIVSLLKLLFYIYVCCNTQKSSKLIHAATCHSPDHLCDAQDPSR